MIDKKKSRLLRRRKIALIASIILMGLLIAGAIFVNYIIKTQATHLSKTFVYYKQCTLKCNLMRKLLTYPMTMCD